MKPSNAEFTAFVGLDWADAKHDICVQAADCEAREFDRFPHRVAAIEEWAHAMQQRFGGRIAVALELSKGPIVYALQKYDFFVLFPINPSMLARYRQAFKPSRAKDDPSDAELALDLLLRHRDQFKPLRPQSVQMRTLLYLVEQRRRLVGDKTRYTNRLGNTLKQYYPQVLQWFEQRDTVLFCDFLTRWPTLSQAKRARKATLRAFFKTHNVRYEQVIASIAPMLSDYALFNALPGAGPQLAPRLLVAFGEQRDRFAGASEFQRYAGIAPVTERSGNKSWVHWRWQCPTFLRQTLVEWAGQTVNKSFWAGAYYRQQMAKGSSHQAAIRALAFKWVRILYRCWQTRTPYDESKYLDALRRRGSPLLKQLGETMQ